MTNVTADVRRAGFSVTKNVAGSSAASEATMGGFTALSLRDETSGLTSGLPPALLVPDLRRPLHRAQNRTEQIRHLGSYERVRARPKWCARALKAATAQLGPSALKRQ